MMIHKWPCVYKAMRWCRHRYMVLSTISEICFSFSVLCCFRLVVAGNACPAGRHNPEGVKCAGVWKYDDRYYACLGAHSPGTMQQDQGSTHCTNNGGIMLLPFSDSDNEIIHAWRGANSISGFDTWMIGQRVVDTSSDCYVNAWTRKSKWIWWHYAKDRSSGQYPWDGAEPKSNCDIKSEMCYSMGSNARWKDRFCSDSLRVLCQKTHSWCDACTTTACGAGSYRTSCPAGSTTDSHCATCTNNPAECSDNHHRVPCTGGGTVNSCTACRTNSPHVQCPHGQWLSPCDRTQNSDTSSCQNCNDITCPVDRYKTLCNPNRMTIGDNTCTNCLHVSCLPGFYFTRCTGSPTWDTSACTLCETIICGGGQYWKQCVGEERRHTCHTCTTTQNCGVGSFRPACAGSPTTDALCTVCANTIVCPVGQYRIPCNGLGGSAATCTNCPPFSTSSQGATSILGCICIADYVLHDGLCARCGAHPHVVGTVQIGVQCEFCEPGKFRTSTTNPACALCPAGKFKVAGVAECSNCGAGKYSSSEGAVSSATCALCLSGKFSIQVGASSLATCSNCWPGTFGSIDGATSCSQCVAGYAQPVPGSVNCNAACSPGTISAATASTCTDCVAGTFQESPAKSTCTSCAPGLISSNTGASACTECSAGTISALSSMSTCTSCAGAQYAPASGASVCLTCAAGSARVDAKTCSACGPGTYVSVAGTSACVTCLAVSPTINTVGIASAVGSTRCTPCDWYEYWFSASECRQCNPGQYLNRVATPAVCVACGVIDSRYCANIKIEMQALQYPQAYSQNFNTACTTTFGANTAELCDGCGCSLFRQDMSVAVQDTCAQNNGNTRSYLHGHTRTCQNCPVNRLINRNVSRRSCDAQQHIVHAQWDETRAGYTCVPGYKNVPSPLAQFACEPCILGTYKANAAEDSCTVCPRNTITRNTASISLEDCSFCSAGQRLVQSDSSGEFSCEPCALCTATRDPIHMERVCPPCTLYEYDAKLSGHPATCVLKYCVEVVRTDLYSNPARAYNGDPQFAYIGPTTFQGGATNWADGVLLMFVTDAQWRREVQRQENTGVAGNNFLDRLNSFATNFQRYTMIPLNAPTVVESFRLMRQNGTPLYVNFQDAYFRLLTRMMNASIAINPISGFDSQNYLSSWTAFKQIEFSENIQAVLSTYSLLDAERLQRETASQSVRSYPFVPPRDVVPLSYKATGGMLTSLVFDIPAAGATFQLLTEISFRGTVLSASMCDTDNIRNGQRCASMFVGNSNVLHFNNTHRSMHSIDLSMVFLEDIHFSVLSATGVNSLAFHASIPVSAYVNPNTRPDAMFGVLDWREKTPVYRACAQDESTSKRATITDPWVFTHVRAAFHQSMCTNVEYA